MTENVASFASVRVATSPCAAKAPIHCCGIAVIKKVSERSFECAFLLRAFSFSHKKKMLKSKFKHFRSRIKNKPRSEGRGLFFIYRVVPLYLLNNAACRGLVVGDELLNLRFTRHSGGAAVRGNKHGGRCCCEFKRVGHTLSVEQRMKKS